MMMRLIPLKIAVAHGDLPSDTGASDLDWADIRASLDGDDAAYGRLVRKYQSQIFSQMWRFTRDSSDQEDLVQETFMEVYKSLKRFKGDSPLLHWIRRIGTRVGYRYWKRKDKERQIKQTVSEYFAGPLSVPEQQTPKDAAEFLYELLAKLEPKDRLILTLFYFEDFDGQEIADRMGWSANLVRVRMHRARQRLGKMLEDLDLEEIAAA